MSDEQVKSPLSAEVEAVIRRLRGVLSASVETDAEGQIQEIHVFADQGRSPGLVSRDVESVLASALDIHIDHRKISVAQMREGREGKGESELPGRLRLTGVTISVDEQTVEARVSLEYGDSAYSGVASSPSYEYDELKLVGSATLQGVDEFVRATRGGQGAAAILSLRDLRLVASEAGQAIVAWIRLARGGSEETVVGCAPVRLERWRASASAILDALNRKLPRLIR
jgi:hypothetical protein